MLFVSIYYLYHIVVVQACCVTVIVHCHKSKRRKISSVLLFIDLRLKVDRAYYFDLLLWDMLLPAIHQMLGKFGGRFLCCWLTVYICRHVTVGRHKGEWCDLIHRGPQYSVSWTVRSTDEGESVQGPATTGLVLLYCRLDIWTQRRCDYSSCNLLMPEYRDFISLIVIYKYVSLILFMPTSINQKPVCY